MILLMFVAFFNTADAKKSKGSEQNTDTTETSKAANQAQAENVPDDKVSQAFAKQLLETTGRGFSPNAGGLTYTQITFSADNTFKADGLVEVMDEEMDCIEIGTWTMDPASSETTANVDWTITSTDCPSRQAPIHLRMQLILTGTPAGIYGNFR